MLYTPKSPFSSGHLELQGVLTLKAVRGSPPRCVCPAALEEAQDKGCGRKATSKGVSAGEVTWDVCSSSNGLYKTCVKPCQQRTGC